LNDDISILRQRHTYVTIINMAYERVPIGHYKSCLENITISDTWHIANNNSSGSTLLGFSFTFEHYFSIGDTKY